MDPGNIERMTAVSLLLIGLTLLFFGLSLSGLFQFPFFGMLVVVTGIISLITAILLFSDSGKQV